MIHKLYLIFLFLVVSISGLAQKKVLDTAALSKWPVIEHYNISDDGKKFFYTVRSREAGNSIIVSAIDLSHSLKIDRIDDKPYFIGDNYLVFNNATEDTIGILNLASWNLSRIDGAYISTFDISNSFNTGKKDWIAYTIKDREKELVFKNLATGQEKRYVHVLDHRISHDGTVAWITVKNGNGSDLYYLYLDHNEDKLISKNEIQVYLTFNNHGGQLAFLSCSPDLKKATLRYYIPGTDSATTIVDSLTEGLYRKVPAAEYPIFSPAGNKLFFYIKDRIGSPPKQEKANPDISVLTYRDDSIALSKNTDFYLACYNLQKKKAVQLSQLKDRAYFSICDGSDDTYVTLESNILGSRRSLWDVRSRPDIYLVNTNDGSRKLLKKRMIVDNGLAFSAKGHFVSWFDRQTAQWQSYDIKRQKLVAVSRKISTPLDYKRDYPGFKAVQQIAGWEADDAFIYLYDRHDLWQVDPCGKKRPINLTKGYGEKNHTRLRLLGNDDQRSQIIQQNDTLILTAFNEETKNYGFYRLYVNGNSSKLEKLTMQPRVMGRGDYDPDLSGGRILMPNVIKAYDKRTYLLSIMDNRSFPNLYVTKNFEQFTQLTNYEPQKDYKWYTTDLLHWKLPDGKPAEGILYKPEGFDPHKKYPIIFYYYEKNVFALHGYLYPELTHADINIPWMVSHGYLVCVPDINYTIGHPGESAFQTISSAATYLKKKTWAGRMGLQGHSFGGWETNYIVTKSKGLFSAACAASGESNFIHGFEDDLPSEPYFESGQGRMGVPTWENPRLYLENSPIFHAPNVQTPLLLMNNKKDNSVDYYEGYHWFQALSRLGKKVWFFSYKGEGHTIENGQNRLDFTMRMEQFFDHFLKGAPEPDWMKQGIQ